MRHSDLEELLREHRLLINGNNAAGLPLIEPKRIDSRKRLSAMSRTLRKDLSTASLQLMEHLGKLAYGTPMAEYICDSALFENTISNLGMFSGCLIFRKNAYYRNNNMDDRLRINSYLKHFEPFGLPEDIPDLVNLESNIYFNKYFFLKSIQNERIQSYLPAVFMVPIVTGIADKNPISPEHALTLFMYSLGGIVFLNGKTSRSIVAFYNDNYYHKLLQNGRYADKIIGTIRKHYP